MWQLKEDLTSTKMLRVNKMQRIGPITYLNRSCSCVFFESEWRSLVWNPCRRRTLLDIFVTRQRWIGWESWYVMLNGFPKFRSMVVVSGTTWIGCSVRAIEKNIISNLGKKSSKFYILYIILTISYRFLYLLN